MYVYACLYTDSTRYVCFSFVYVSSLYIFPPSTQVPDRSIESRVLAQLLMAIIDDPYYDSLRTQQQLGYLVFSGVNSVEGIR